MATASTQSTRTRGSAPPPPPSRSAPPTSAALPAPRFATAWAALVYFVASMTLAYPAIAGRILLNPVSDQFKAGYAFREFAAQSLRSGHGFPLWNPVSRGRSPVRRRDARRHFLPHVSPALDAPDGHRDDVGVSDPCFSLRTLHLPVSPRMGLQLLGRADRRPGLHARRIDRRIRVRGARRQIVREHDAAGRAAPADARHS